MKSSNRTNNNDTAFRWPLTKNLSRSETNSLVHGINSSSGSSGVKIASSTPSSPRRNGFLCRQRQTVNNTSPLHVAAMFASTARQLSAIAASDLPLFGGANKQNSFQHLFMTSDEVFKAWEAHLHIDDDQLSNSPSSTTPKASQRFKKFSSLELGESAAYQQRSSLRKSHSPLSQSEDDETAPISDHSSRTATTSQRKNTSTLELTTVPTDSELLDDSGVVRARSLSIQQSGLETKLLENSKRRSSGALNKETNHIKKVDLQSEYNIYRQLGTGRLGYIKLSEHKTSKIKLALKFFPRPQIKQGDFIREYNFSRFLSPHQNILCTFEGMFQPNDQSAFFFVQELCPHASLREAVENSNTGIGEAATKLIMLKVLSAIEFMHDENLVHRNIKAENILIFDPTNYSKIKVTDFGLTRKTDTSVKQLEYVNPYHAPELCETVVREMLTVNKAIDVWALGVLFFYCLKGKFPWQKATIMCKPYWEWDQWLKHKLPQLPKQYELYTEKALKLFKRCLNPKPKDRWSVKNLKKFVEKEHLIKSKNTVEEPVYYTEDSHKKSSGIHKKKSTIQKLINSTFQAMAEISDQVVSARDE